MTQPEPGPLPPRGNEPPSAIVISMFETLQRQVVSIYDYMRANDVRATERHTKIDGLIETLSARVEIQNGGVKTALELIAASEKWHHEHDAAAAVAEAEGRGRKAQRAADRAKLDAVQAFFDDWWKLIIGVGLGGFGLFELLWRHVG